MPGNRNNKKTFLAIDAEGSGLFIVKRTKPCPSAGHRLQLDIPAHYIGNIQPVLDSLYGRPIQKNLRSTPLNNQEEAEIMYNNTV